MTSRHSLCHSTSPCPIPAVGFLCMPISLELPPPSESPILQPLHGLPTLARTITASKGETDPRHPTLLRADERDYYDWCNQPAVDGDKATTGDWGVRLNAWWSVLAGGFGFACTSRSFAN